MKVNYLRPAEHLFVKHAGNTGQQWIRIAPLSLLWAVWMAGLLYLVSPHVGLYVRRL
ncbi:hypothetical protein TSMEX_006729 [Taenia solium]|eukprot:TsM_000625400 transcript=TsM_000625400 gene=TsM_000625400